MNRFLLPEKSAIPESIGERNETTRNDAESMNDINTEFDISVPKKSTVTFKSGFLRIAAS
jgi:hypothetical protein